MPSGRVSFSQRFIVLTVVGYLTAVAAAALAVRTGSGPVLKAWQDQAIYEHAEANAQAVRIALREIGLKTQLLATNNDIIKITIGDESDLDRAHDLLQGFHQLDGLLNVTVIDFAGAHVLDHQFDTGYSRRFTWIDHVGVVRSILAGSSDEFQFSFRPGKAENDHHFLIAQPIRQNGYVEGVLVAEVAVDVSSVFTKKTSAGTAQIATSFQHAILNSVAGDKSIAVQVEDTDFYVVLVPDRQSVTATGEELVDKVLYAVGIFLVFPFCLMGGAGLRSIVAPHKALEMSQIALRQNQKKLSELADIAQRSNDAIISTDLNGCITWVNLAFTTSTGFSIEDVLGKTPGEVLQGEETDKAEKERIAVAMANRQPIRSEILNYDKSGKPYWNALSIAPQIDENGYPYGFVAISSDITEKRHAQDEVLRAKAVIEHQANHDALTGLPNRRALDAELDRLRKQPTQRVLVRIDLDHFKNVNDTLGHAAGDHVLIVVSDLLKAHVRKGDMAARVGGDEFVILMDDTAKPEDAVSLSERLLKEIQNEIVFDDKICRIGASFGVASTKEGMLTNGELLLGADSALYVAKEAGRNRVVSYTEQLHNDVVTSRYIAKEIERAIANNEFEPFFHPQFDAKTFAFTGLEALVRWRHPTRGILPPSEFLDIAEQLSVARDIDDIMLNKGLDLVNKLNGDGFHIPKVSFNVVASRLEEPDLPEAVHQLSFDGTQVTFEVLESVLVEEQSELFQARVDLLRDIGLGIEVDDFGSGHASIIGLTKLSPDTMKIDQRLIFPVVESPVARKMVRAVVEIGRALGISVTAEGVETAGHAIILADLGCDTLQGFLFAKPMSVNDLKAYLSTYDPEVFRAQCLKLANTETIGATQSLSA